MQLVVKNPPANEGDIRDADLFPGLGRFPGVWHCNPFQYSCLENPMDRGDWWATVHWVSKSQTQVKQLGLHAPFIGRLSIAPNFEKWVITSTETFLPFAVFFPHIAELVTQHWISTICKFRFLRAGPGEEPQSLRQLVSPGTAMMITYSLNAHIEIQICCSLRGDEWSPSGWHPCISFSPFTPEHWCFVMTRSFRHEWV